MKKILGIVFVMLFLIGGIGIMVWNHIYGNEPTVESTIQKDKQYFDNMAGKIIFYESEVQMDTTFSDGDKFVAVEVNNVFEQVLDSTTNVYEFKHVNYGTPQITIHHGQAWLEDVQINPDSLGMTFEQAYNRAKQSDLTPSKSKYMTLRNPLGPQRCNPQYIIGNDKLGIMFVDSKSGDVSDKNPAFNK